MTTRLLALRHGSAWKPALPRRLTLADAPTMGGSVAAAVAWPWFRC